MPQYVGAVNEKGTPFRGQSPRVSLTRRDLQDERGCDILTSPRAKMLKLLRISNIAVIQAVEIELGPGLTLFTGETGAGKSIVIDALGLILGSRASGDLIRTGEEQATVEALVEDPRLIDLLRARGLPVEGDEVILRREIHASGKGRASVNGALVPTGT